MLLNTHKLQLHINVPSDSTTKPSIIFYIGEGYHQFAIIPKYFVKAFSSAGAATMVNPHYQDGQPTMFICGNDEPAKQEAAQILNKLGWEAQDMGGEKSARAIEPLSILWCIPGIQHNQWTHAFKLLKK